MRIAVFLFFCVTSLLSGQNLVPNPSFENIKDSINVISKSSFHFSNKIYDWYSINDATPDILSSLFYYGYISTPLAKSGNRMAGIISQHSSGLGKNRWGEYLCVLLNDRLVPNKTYYIEYWIRRAVCINPERNIDNNMNPYFGMFFYLDSLHLDGQKIVKSKSLIKNTTEFDRVKMIEAKPQVEGSPNVLLSDQNWIKISNYFTPKDEYNKMCLGQFWEEIETNQVLEEYYLIDDILIEELFDFDLLINNTKLSVGTIVPLKNVEFNSGNTELSNINSLNQLNKLVLYLKENSNIKIRVNGHTDNVGSKESNFKLSKERAKFIAKYIIKSGIKKDRIKWEGFADEKPIADNRSEDGRSQNRRVEFEIIP